MQHHYMLLLLLVVVVVVVVTAAAVVVVVYKSVGLWHYLLGSVQCWEESIFRHKPI